MAIDRPSAQLRGIRLLFGGFGIVFDFTFTTSQFGFSFHWVVEKF